jgi:septal ring factor EnvC (AmiA/AmiB activator)
MQNLTIEILAARERDLEAEIAQLRAQLARAQHELDAARDLEAARERDVLSDMGGAPPATPAPSDAPSDAQLVESALARATARRLRRG